MSHLMFWLSVVAAAIIGIFLFKLVANASGVSGLKSFADGI